MPTREHDRQSGTGAPIKGELKKGGAGAGNWGADSEAIEDAVAVHDGGVGAVKKKRRPESTGDLQAEEKKPEPTTFDDLMKSREKAKPWTVKAKKGTMKKASQSTAKEKVTDDLFAGDRRGKKKRVRKKASAKTIKASYSFKDETLAADKPEREWGSRERQQRPGAGFGSFGRGARVFEDAPPPAVEAYQPADRSEERTAPDSEMVGA